MLRHAIFASALLLGASPALAAATLYKDPSCGCCRAYGEHLEESGFEVTVVDTPDLTTVKAEHGVPDELQGCHSLVVEGYVVEGHVPVAVVDRMLTERPDIRGISLPGMPAGSPGMMGEKEGPFEILTISDGPPTVYATE